jgi:hypothetical protein
VRHRGPKPGPDPLDQPQWRARRRDLLRLATDSDGGGEVGAAVSRLEPGQHRQATADRELRPALGLAGTDDHESGSAQLPDLTTADDVDDQDVRCRIAGARGVRRRPVKIAAELQPDRHHGLGTGQRRNRPGGQSVGMQPADDRHRRRYDGGGQHPP